MVQDPGQEPRIELEAPETVDPPVTVWDVAFDSSDSPPGGPPPLRVVAVSACLVVPSGASPRDVVVVLEGPGVITPTSPTRFDQVQPGGEAVVTWRWAAPLRAQPPPYDLQLEARAEFTSGDERGAVTASRSVRVPPPPPPTEDSYVSDLPFDWGTNGYGPIERDQANGSQDAGGGAPIRLDGVEYQKGLGVNALALVGFHLGGVCETFTAKVGVDDVRGGGGSVIFRVLADGEVVYESDVLRGSSPAQDVSVDVTGVQQLDLVADPTEDGQGNDGADWADAFVTVTGGARR